MEQIKITTIPNMNVNAVIDKLSFAYSKIINANLPLKTMPSVMLWGAPGVGKSDAVRQIASKIGDLTSKKVVITDVRLLLFNPVDLRGIPTANADKTLAVWLKPKIFQMDDSSDTINILFLDEISAAPVSVQASAYQITLDRQVGEHKLPENCIVIAAGNRVSDKSVAYKMPKALANRLLHIDVEGDFKSWKQWAIKHGINEKIIGFLSFNESMLMQFNSSSDDLAFPTPRSWEMASNILNYVSDDVKQARDLISGLIGKGATAEFLTWTRIYKDLPDVNLIFEGQNVKVPTSVDALYAISSSIIAHARTIKNDMVKIENAINYISKLPPDFSIVAMKDLMYIEDDYKLKLMKIPSFIQFMKTRGALINEFN